MIILGLTGSIAMGKSAAARTLRGLGLPVFDSDLEVHDLLAAGGAVGAAVEDTFPGVTEKGIVNRVSLGARVFDDPAALKKLEAILHPAVGAARQEFLDACRSRGEKLVVLDVPLLFETGGDAGCDHVMVVSAPADIQRQRALAREGMTEERLAAILSQQMPDAEKRRRADFVISTNQPPEKTLKEIRAVVDGLIEEAGEML